MSIEAAFFGTLGRDAESKTSKNGKDYLRINVRVGDGDAVQWCSVMVFDPEAIAAADRLVRGSRVYIEGSLKLGSWQRQDGTERHGLSVMSWHTRLAAIGRNKPRRERDEASDERKPSSAQSSAANHHDDRQRRVRGTADPTLNDEIPFGPEFR